MSICKVDSKFTTKAIIIWIIRFKLTAAIFAHIASHSLKRLTRRPRNIFIDRIRMDFIQKTSVTTDHEFESDVIFKVGLIGDTQYADEDNGSNYDRSVIRRYRQSLDTLNTAAQHFRSNSVCCSILLGDVLDKKASDGQSQNECLSRVMAVIKASGHSWHFALGNHDYCCFSRELIYEKYFVDMHREKEDGICARCNPHNLFYSFTPFAGFRFIMLDGYDVSTLGPSNPAHDELAWDIIRTDNPNFRSDPVGDWFLDLTKDRLKYVPFNGAIGAKQKDWLKTELDAALLHGEACIVFCHIPCDPNTFDKACLLWNNDEVLDILHSNTAAVAYIAGHDHEGSYTQDECGLHHLVLPSPLECAEGEVSFGHVEVHKGHMNLVWTGKTGRTSAGQPWPSRMAFERVTKPPA